MNTEQEEAKIRELERIRNIEQQGGRVVSHDQSRTLFVCRDRWECRVSEYIIITRETHICGLLVSRTTCTAQAGLFDATREMLGRGEGAA